MIPHIKLTKYDGVGNVFVEGGDCEKSCAAGLHPADVVHVEGFWGLVQFQRHLLLQIKEIYKIYKGDISEHGVKVG